MDMTPIPVAVAPMAQAAAHPGGATGAVTVFIRDLRVETLIGVYAAERVATRTLVMDLDIELDACRAADSDDISDTVDYAVVVADVRAELARKDYFLLERLAEFVAGRILARFGARRVAVRVAKPGVIEGVGAVGVSIERFRP